MSESGEKDAPTCRTCYAQTLSKYERARFWDEPITGCVYYCPEHQAVHDRILASLPDIQYVKREPGAKVEFQTVEMTCPNDGQSLAWHLETGLDPQGDPRTNAAFIGCDWTRVTPPRGDP